MTSISYTDRYLNSPYGRCLFLFTGKQFALTLVNVDLI
jgi:hypothetical protein